MQLVWPQTFLNPNNIEESTLIHHHLEGLYYVTTQDQRWKNRWKQQWIHNELKCSVLKELSTQLQQKSITPVLLKGMDLLFRIYNDFGSRFLSDIDLYISAEQLNSFIQILENNHFRQIKEKRWMGNKNKRLFSKQISSEEIVIEVHTQLFYHFPLQELSITPSPLDGYNQLSLEFLFVHLAGHLAFQHNFLKLYWLLDIYYLYQNYFSDIDWSEVFRLSKELQLQRSIIQVLWVLKRYFSCQVPFYLPVRSIESTLIDYDLLINESQEGLNYFLLKHFTKDSLCLALKYDLLWIKDKLI